MNAMKTPAAQKTGKHPLTQPAVYENIQRANRYEERVDVKEVVIVRKDGERCDEVQQPDRHARDVHQIKPMSRLKQALQPGRNNHQRQREGQ